MDTYSQTKADCTCCSMKFCLVLGQYFGIFPNQDLNHPTHLHFKWKSFRVFYTLFLTTLLLFSIIMCYILHNHGYFMLTDTVTTIFYFFGIAILLSFLHIARNLAKLINNWTAIDKIMNQNYGYPKELDLTLKYQTICASLLYLGEVMFGVFFALTRPVGHHPHKKFYFKNTFPEIYYHNNIHPALKIVSTVASCLCTFILVYNDLFIVIISTCLALRFCQITRRISEHEKKQKNGNYWRTIRQDYDRLAVLCKSLDNNLSFLVLLSFASNIFFVLIQIHFGLRMKSDTMGVAYFFYSFCHLVGRLVGVSLYASWINDESKKPRDILNSIPSNTYNTEIQRLMLQINLDNVVLTGSKMFRITRGLILNIAKAIVTYELVLLQVSSESSTS